MSNFKIGDVVRLKSGGPPMTVEAIGPCMVQHDDTTWYALNHEMMVYCRWFARVQAGDLVVDPTTLGERFHVATLDRIAEASGPSSSLDVQTDAPAYPLTVRGAETCRQCLSVLMFSARARGDGLCGPCSRGAEFKVLDASRLRYPSEVVSCIECGRTARIASTTERATESPWWCANCAPKVKPAHANGVALRESGG